jgi:hypothetical protein
VISVSRTCLRLVTFRMVHVSCSSFPSLSSPESCCYSIQGQFVPLPHGKIVPKECLAVDSLPHNGSHRSFHATLVVKLGLERLPARTSRWISFKPASICRLSAKGLSAACCCSSAARLLFIERAVFHQATVRRLGRVVTLDLSRTLAAFFHQFHRRTEVIVIQRPGVAM